MKRRYKIIVSILILSLTIYLTNFITLRQCKVFVEDGQQGTGHTVVVNSFGNLNAYWCE